MNNLLTLLLCLTCLISKYNMTPATRRYNIYDGTYYNDFEDENSINDGSETIDLSSLGPEAYGFPDSDSGNAVAEWSESSLVNPEEVGNYAEGDILMPPQKGRNGIRDESQRWPKGVIPYSIEGHFSTVERETIMKAIADYHRLTCLRFVPYSGQNDYLAIQSKNTGCWSSVGKIGGRQEVNLQAPGCVSKKGTVIHELLHAIGFMHEQSRPERDQFVTVRYNNIKTGAENNFRKADPRHTNDFDVPYDYNSVMHYSEYAFSKNQQKTIDPKVSGVKLGQRDGLSRGDVKKVNNMYGCKKELYAYNGNAGYNIRPTSYHGNAGNNIRPTYYGNAGNNIRPTYYGNAGNNIRPTSYYGNTGNNIRPASYYGNADNNIRPTYPHFPRYPSYPHVDRFPRRRPSPFRFPRPAPPPPRFEPQSGWLGNVFQSWFGNKS